jgi:hypothetical protein
MAKSQKTRRAGKSPRTVRNGDREAVSIGFIGDVIDRAIRDLEQGRERVRQVREARKVVDYVVGTLKLTKATARLHCEDSVASWFIAPK